MIFLVAARLIVFTHTITQARMLEEGGGGVEQEADCPVGEAGAGGRGIMEGDMDPGAAGERGGGAAVGTGVVVCD